MLPANPYGEDLGDRDPLTALAETPERMRRLFTSWTDDRFERTYAPGKWSMAQMAGHDIHHFKQLEMVR